MTSLPASPHRTSRAEVPRRASARAEPLWVQGRRGGPVVTGGGGGTSVPPGAVGTVGSDVRVTSDATALAARTPLAMTAAARVVMVVKRRMGIVPFGVAVVDGSVGLAGMADG